MKTSDHDKNMEEIRRCCAEPNSLMAFCGMDGARMLCNALDAYEALEHERKADQDFANQERERADRLIAREVELTEEIAKLAWLLKQWRTYYRQEVCSVGNEPPEKLMLETAEALNE